MGRIQDVDVRNALQTLEDEIENYEANIEELEQSLDKANKKIVDLEDEVESLEAKVKELEEALAEAYLTSEAHNENLCDTGHSRATGSSEEALGEATDREES